MCNTCCNMCNPCNCCNPCGGLFSTLFGNSCNRCGCHAVNTANACGNAANTANMGGCGCGCGCNCRRRVSVPITGRIYFDLPLAAAQTASETSVTNTNGCTAYNSSVTGLSVGNSGFDAYYARQYGLYPYNTTNSCGCGN